MKLTKQQLITVIKEELNTMLVEEENLLNEYEWSEPQEWYPTQWTTPTDFSHPADEFLDIGRPAVTWAQEEENIPAEYGVSYGEWGKHPSWEKALKSDRDRIRITNTGDPVLTDPFTNAVNAERNARRKLGPSGSPGYFSPKTLRAMRKAIAGGDTGWGPGSLEENMLQEDGTRPEYSLSPSWDQARMRDIATHAAWPGYDDPANYVPNWLQIALLSGVPNAADYGVIPDPAYGPGTPAELASTAAAWEDARETGDTGWGPGSLEETIQFELANILKELK